MDTAVELIKSMALHEQGLNILIHIFVRQKAILKKDFTLEAADQQKMRALFISERFLKPYAERFRKLFSQEEIASLLEIYQSKLMQKMLDASKDLLDPLYEGMSKKMNELLS